MLNRSLTALILSNLTPIYGLLFLGWELSTLLFLYWFENIVIGIYTIFMMRKATGQIVRGVHVSKMGGSTEYKSKTALILFFILHFGIFTIAHGSVIFSVLIQDFQINETVIYTIVLLFASHGFSYLTHFLGNEEYRKKGADTLFFAPYKRVFVLHITVLAGAIYATQTGNTGITTLLVIVLAKTAADIYARRSEHLRYLE